MQRLLVLAARFTLGACLLLTLLGAFAPPSSGIGFLPWDKANHFVAFFAITCAAVVAFPRLGLVWIAGGVSALGAGVELGQALPFIARDCDVWDWVADDIAVLAVIGVLVAGAIRRGASGPS